MYNTGVDVHNTVEGFHNTVTGFHSTSAGVYKTWFGVSNTPTTFQVEAVQLGLYQDWRFKSKPEEYVFVPSNY